MSFIIKTVCSRLDFRFPSFSLSLAGVPFRGTVYLLVIVICNDLASYEGTTWVIRS